LTDDTVFSYENIDKLRVFTDTKGSTKVIRPEIFLWRGVNTPFFSVFDTFGYVMSLIGTAPQDASRENYFLPLAATFSKNLINLGGTINQTPNRAFIAFNDRLVEPREILFSIDINDVSEPSRNELDVALGANIGGANQFKSAIQEMRFYWMREEGRLDLGANPNLSLVRKTLDGRGQLFGHCAETIPLVIQLG
jgi:hypothetical protein